MYLEGISKDLACEALLENLQWTCPQVPLFWNRITLEIITGTKSVSPGSDPWHFQETLCCLKCCQELLARPYTVLKKKKNDLYSHVNLYCFKPDNG